MNMSERLSGWLWNNPVVLKELRIGLRERRIVILQIVYLCFLLLISLGYLPDLLRSNDYELMSESGRGFFFLLYAIQLLMLLILGPALTCGTISGERERHSLDMVLVSGISSSQFVLGKLGFAMYCILLLLSSALPLASMCFFLGSLTFWEALSHYIELFLFAMLAASVGLFASARESRSNYATVQSYLLVFIFSFLLIPYFLLRFEESAGHVIIGPSVWTLQTTFEISIYHFFVGLAFYVIAFLFVKARHRVRPQARNLKAMAVLFLLLDVFCWGWLFLMSSSFGPSHGRLDESLLLLVYAVHILGVGFFLFPTQLESVREEKYFQTSIFSKSFFWLSLSILGCLFYSGWSVLWDFQDEKIACASVFVVFFLLVYSACAWLLRKSWLPGWHYAWVYYLGLVILQFLAIISAVMTVGGSDSGYWFSPFNTLKAIIDGVSDNRPRLEIMMVATGFYSILLLILSCIYIGRRRHFKKFV